MAYDKTHWKDHVVERPRTYTKVDNADGSYTEKPAPGNVLQTGTPQSAANFNHLEDAVQHLSVAFDLMMCANYAKQRDYEAKIALLTEQLAASTA